MSLYNKDIHSHLSLQSLYDIDVPSVPWLPLKFNDNNELFEQYDYFIIEYKPHISSSSTSPTLSPSSRSITISPSSPLWSNISFSRDYSWRISIWYGREEKVRLSSDFLIPVHGLDDNVFIFEIPKIDINSIPIDSYNPNNIGDIHVVIELTHIESLVLLAQAVCKVHLKSADYIYNNDRITSQFEQINYNTINLIEGQCRNMDIELNDVYNILQLPSESLPLFSTKFSYFKSFSKATNWTSTKKLNIILPSIPSAREFIENLESKFINVTHHSNSRNFDVINHKSVKRVYLTIKDLQLTGDLLHIHQNNLIVISAEVYDHISTYLGSIYNNQGTWSSSSEINVFELIQNNGIVEKINIVLSLVTLDSGSLNHLSLHSSWPGLRQTLICNGTIIKPRGISSGKYEVELYVGGEGRAQVGVAVIDVSNLQDDVTSNTQSLSMELKSQYNRIRDVLISNSPLPLWLLDGKNDIYSDNSIYDVLGIADIINSISVCCRRLQGKYAGYSPSKKATANIDYKGLVLFVCQSLVESLLRPEICDKNTIKALGKCLESTEANFAIITLLQELMNSNALKKLIVIANSLSHIDEIHDITNKSKVLTEEEKRNLKCACSCLMLLSYSCDMNIASIDGNYSMQSISEDLLHTILSYGVKAIENIFVCNIPIHNVLIELASVLENASMLLHAAGSISEEIAESFAGLVTTICRGFLTIEKENERTVHSCIAILIQFLSLMLKSHPNQIDMLCTKNFSFTWLKDSPKLPDFCPIPTYSKCGDLLNQSMFMLCDYIDNIFIEDKQDCVNMMIQSAMMELVSTIRSTITLHLALHNSTDRNNFDLPQASRRMNHQIVELAMNQYSRNIGSSSLQVLGVTSPFASNKILKATSPTIPFSPISRKAYSAGLKFTSGHESHLSIDDKDDINIQVKSGEEALIFLGECAFFLEAYLKYLLKLTNNTSKIPVESFEHVIRRESVIHFSVLESRKLLELSINSVMKGHTESNMIGSIFNAISAIGTMPAAHNLVFFLTHATATISYTWSNYFKLQSGSQVFQIVTESPLTFESFKQDGELLLHSISILMNRVTVDPFLSSDYVKIIMKSISNKKKIKNNLDLELSTVEDSFKVGPIQQWVRFWQYLVTSISDMIKAGHVDGLLEKDTKLHNSLVSALCNLCLLDKLCQDDDLHRPDLAILCLDGENQASNLLQKLLEAASSLPVTDAYELSRQQLLHTCFHLMKHLAHDPVENPFDLKMVFFSLLDSLVYTTLHINSSIEKFCPSLSLIWKIYNGMEHQFFQTAPAACATVMKSLYNLMNLMISDEYHVHIFDANDRAALFILQQELKRKYKALRLYVCSRLFCKNHPFQLDDYNLPVSSSITAASFSRFSNLFSSAGLQALLPATDYSTTTNVWSVIDKILCEILEITKTGRGLDLLTDICLFKNYSNLYLSGSSKTKQHSIATEFALDPVDNLGFGHLGNQHLFNLCVRLRELQTSDDKKMDSFTDLFRMILNELQLCGEWECALRLVDSLLNETNQIGDLNQQKFLLSEQRRVKEVVEEYLREDGLKRPCPIFYAVRFSDSPYETADILAKLNLEIFADATFCLSSTFDNQHNNDNIRFGDSGTWLVFRIDGTAYVGGAALYSNYANVKLNDGVELPAFLPPQSYNSFEYLLSSSFPNFSIISSESNEYIGEYRHTNTIQIFHAYPADICDELYGHSDDVDSSQSEWEKIMHSKRFYIYTDNCNDHDSNVDSGTGLVKYTLSTERVVHIASLSKEFFENDMSGQGSISIDKTNLLDMSSSMHWISPCTLGFIEDAEVVNSAEACANVMHVQTLMLSSIVTALKYHNSLNENERRAIPYGNIVSLLSIMTAAISYLSNMTGIHNGNIVGIHNSAEVMSGEVERRNIAWQDLRKSVKQNYLREKEKYEEDVENLTKRYKELMDKISDSDGSDITLNRYTRKMKNKMKEYDDNEYSDVKYLLTKQFEQMMPLSPEEPDLVQLEEDIMKGLLPMDILISYRKQAIDTTRECLKEMRIFLKDMNILKDNQANSLHEEDFKLWHSLVIWIESRVYGFIDLSIHQSNDDNSNEEE